MKINFKAMAIVAIIGLGLIVTLFYCNKFNLEDKQALEETELVVKRINFTAGELCVYCDLAPKWAPEWWAKHKDQCAKVKNFDTWNNLPAMEKLEVLK